MLMMMCDEGRDDRGARTMAGGWVNAIYGDKTFIYVQGLFGKTINCNRDHQL